MELLHCVAELLVEALGFYPRRQLVGDIRVELSRLGASVHLDVTKHGQRLLEDFCSFRVGIGEDGSDHRCDPG
ncbi:hypothetical protein [Amycolatopsis sp. lyj-112]|uniref:hypothetical protein n=1 Tax=Amycolatopsis sp. lyj-112 TaxID=2789288 RepID=UPI00397A80A6